MMMKLFYILTVITLSYTIVTVYQTAHFECVFFIHIILAFKNQIKKLK